MSRLTTNSYVFSSKSHVLLDLQLSSLDGLATLSVLHLYGVATLASQLTTNSNVLTD